MTSAHRFSRRTVLRAAGGLGAAAAFGARLNATSAQDSTSGITIPQPSTTLPTDDVTFRWIDSGDLKSFFYKALFAKYHEAHGNITIKYDPLPWDEINRIVPLGVQNGNAHDVFAMPPDVPAATAVAEGWVAALDDIMPNFTEWKARFPIGSFTDGVTDFGGKTYTFPVTSDKRSSTVLFYNPAILQKVGVDPSAKPLTWTEFREAAQKITKQGKGQEFGLLLGGGKASSQFPAIIGNLSRMIHPAGGSSGAATYMIDWKTGDYIFTSDAVIGAIELLLAMKSDGSIVPGAASLGSADARARFPQGHAGMIFSGPWDIVNYQTNSPDFKFALASQPVPDSGTPAPLTFEQTGSNLNWVYAKSKYHAITADLFSYIGSVDGQVAIMAATKGNLQSLFPEAAKQAQETVQMDPLAKTALDLFNSQIRLGPMMSVRVPDYSAVQFGIKKLNPDFGDVIQGLFSGQLKDPKKAMQDLQDRSNKNLDDAIKAAQAKGAKVTRDDWIYPNWDPTKDYGEADYKALT